MSAFDYSSLWGQPVFSVLSTTQQQWLSERISVETFLARTSIYQPTDPADHLYFVLDGKIKVEAIPTSGGNPLIKRICLSGDFFGTKGLLEAASYQEHATTLRRAAHLVKIKIPNLRRLTEVNYEFAQKWMFILWQEMVYLEERTVVLTELSAYERFSKFLLEMARREGEFDGKEWVINSQLTQAEIGAYIGTGRQTVTEILGAFQKQGILRYSWGRFFVRSLERLS